MQNNVDPTAEIRLMTNRHIHVLFAPTKCKNRPNAYPYIALYWVDYSQDCQHWADYYYLSGGI